MFFLQLAANLQLLFDPALNPEDVASVSKISP
jgi:hypothetical protein